jgi:hypothetical protein
MANSEIAKFVAANDNANDYADNLMDGLRQAAREDIDALLRETTGRDEELFEEFGVEPDLNVDDYDGTPGDQRDLDWSLGLSGLFAAALYQFVLDRRDDTIIKPLAYRAQAMGGFDLSRSDLVTAGKRDAELLPATPFDKIGSGYLTEFAFLKEPSNAELYGQLVEVEALAPVDKEIAAAQGYVARMSEYPPGSARAKGGLADVVEWQSGSGLKQIQRRATEQLNALREVGALTVTGIALNLAASNKPMAWIAEGGKSICEYCKARAGDIRTYSQWLADGVPGAEVCAGGNRCRCHLMAV